MLERKVQTLFLRLYLLPEVVAMAMVVLVLVGELLPLILESQIKVTMVELQRLLLEQILLQQAAEAELVKSALMVHLVWEEMEEMVLRLALPVHLSHVAVVVAAELMLL
jgi:hypothetical protein